MAVIFPINSSYAGEVLPQDCTDCFSCDGGATVTTEEVGELTYRWLNNQGDEVFQEVNSLGTSSVANLCQGIYYVAISEDNTTLETYSFNIAVVGTDPGDNSEYVTCTSGNTFTLTSSLEGNPLTGGVWSDASGGTVAEIFDPAVAGTQSFIYTLDAGACDVSAELVIVTNEPAYAGNSTTYDICDHYDPFELFDVLNENPEPNGEWLNTEGEVFDGVFVPGVDPSGQYIYRIDTVPGCPPVYSNVNMDVHEYPNAGMDTSLIICSEAEEIDLVNYLTDDADLDGVWRDPQNEVITSTLDPGVDPAGDYKYVVSGTTPCPTISSTFEVIIDTLVTAGNDTDASICESSDAVDLTGLLEGMPDDYGVWTNEAGDEVSPLFDPATDTPQTFQYAVEAIGCVAEIAFLNLTLDANPTAGQDSSLVLCENAGSLDLNDYLSDEAWASGGWFQNGGLINGQDFTLTAGSSQVSYIALNGACPMDTAIVNIQVDELPESIEDQNWQFCDSESEVDLSDELNSSIPNLSFFDIATDQQVATFEPGQYDGGGFYCISYSSNICPDDTSLISVEIVEKVFADTAIAASVCESVETVDLDSYLTIEMPNDGSWSDVSEPINQNQLIDSPGDFEFYYTVENGGICESSVLSLNLHVSDQLTAGNDSVISLCETSGTIDLNTLKSADAADGGTWWQEDTQLNSTFWNPGDEGSGVIEYLVNSEEPCPPSTAVFEVVVDEAVDVTLPQEFSACANSPAQQVTPVQAGDYDYSWEESPLLSSQSLSNPWLNFGAVQNSYSINSITVLIENGACQKIDSVLVEVLPYPIVELLGDNSICEDEPYQFTASGADSYQWNGIPLGSELDSISVAGVATSDFDFSVIGLNEFGCEGSAEAFVSVLDTPEVELNVIGEDGCAPVNVQLSFDSQQEIVSYYWVLNGDFVNQEIGSVLELDQPGEHELELNVTASNGCAAHFESAGNFEVYENPVADFLFEDESVVAINPKVSILNTSVAADSYFWNFGQLGSSVEENPTMYFTGEEPGFYEACLTAETDFGCIDTICKTIELEGEYSIYLPNAFTPDGDGLNEVFKPVMQGVDPSEYLFVIFNRWGEKVFESKDPSRGWIGNHRGGNHYVPPAVYNWQLKVKNRFTGEIEKMSGHISVLR